jgi:WXG100 family type VII secretion target
MLKVTPVQLNNMSGSVNRTAADVEGSHKALKSQLSPLFGADWSGQAAAQFGALYENFDTHARGLNEALHGIGLLLNSAGNTYATAEQQIAASFRS